MSTQYRYSMYAAQFVHAGGDLDLTQIESDSISAEAMKRIVRPGGSLDPGAIILSHADPMRRFATAALDTLLGDVSLTTGLACSSGGTMWLQRRAEQAAFASGSNHHSITSSLGFLQVDEIRARQDDENGAVATCLYTPIWDASTLPFVINSGASLATAPAPAFDSQFFLGGVYVNTTAFEGVQDLSIRPGIVFKTKRADGDIYPRKGSIIARNPEIRIVCDKIDNLSGVLDNLFVDTPSNTVNCYFSKGVAGGSRVAAATTSHIKISAAAGEWSPDDISVDDTDDATTTIVMRPTGTIALSTASAIP